MPQIIKTINDVLYRSRYVFMVLTLISFWGQMPMWYGNVNGALTWLLIGGIQSVVLALMVGSGWLCVRVLGWMGATVLALISVINAFAWSQWGFGISNKMFIIILETNAREASGFMESVGNCMAIILKNRLFWLGTLVSVFMVVGVRWIRERAWCIVMVLWVVGGLVGSVNYMMECNKSGFGRKNISLIFKTISDLKFTLSMLPTTEANKAEFLANMPEVPEVVCDDVTDNVVFIIGESSSMRHWSVYGYGLRTTPRMEQMAESVVVYTDVLPPAPSTTEALAKVLTEKNSTNKKSSWSSCVDLIRMARAAGFRTLWFSNQEKCGPYTGCIPVLADCADTCCYRGMYGFNDNDMLQQDEVLLGALASMMTGDVGQKKMGIFHTMGSHIPYRERYPKGWDVFHKEDYEALAEKRGLTEEQVELMAHYDNSIAYTDYFLSLMTEECAKHRGRNLLIYFSDHSEDVFDIDDYYGHARRGPFVKVPMIIWASKEWQAANAALWQRMKGAKDERIATENSIHLFHSLLGMHSAIYDAQRDFVSTDYERNGKRYFDEEVYED